MNVQSRLNLLPSEPTPFEPPSLSPGPFIR